MRIAADAAGIGDRIEWIAALNPKGIRGKIILQTPRAKNTDINVTEQTDSHADQKRLINQMKRDGIDLADLMRVKS